MKKALTLFMAIVILLSNASEVFATSNYSVSIDRSNISEGYITVNYTGDDRNDILVRITKNGFRSHYHFISLDETNILPLTRGNGTYTIEVFRRIGSYPSNRWANLFNTDINVTLRCELLPFLQPNINSNFTSSGVIAELATQLAHDYCPTITTANIFQYMLNGFHICDEIRNSSRKPCFIPNLYELFITRRGWCFAQASMMTALLRLNDIPARLVFGYYDPQPRNTNHWHAWVEVHLPETGWTLFDPSTGAAVQYAFYHEPEAFSENRTMRVRSAERMNFRSEKLF